MKNMIASFLLTVFMMFIFHLIFIGFATLAAADYYVLPTIMFFVMAYYNWYKTFKDKLDE